MKRLQGKVAVITGGGGGIGRAAASLFAAEGARVLLVDLEQNLLEQAVTAVGPNAASYAVADVSVPEQVKDYVRTALDRYGRIDVFFNNAGIEGAVKTIDEYPIDVFDRVMAVNVRGVWLGLKYVMPVMKQAGGSVIITSSISGIKGFAQLSAYVTSKHAGIGIMRSAALEGAPFGIRVNSINPAPIETRMMRALEEGAAPGAASQAKAGFETMMPLKRYGTPDEVALLALFLASDESRYCTGGVYPVDGGVSAA